MDINKIEEIKTKLKNKLKIDLTRSLKISEFSLIMQKLVS